MRNLEELGIKKELLPQSKATNAYELLDEVVAVIQERNERLHMGYWIETAEKLYDNGEITDKPACGTVCCVAGWVVTLREGVEQALELNNYHSINMGVRREASRLLVGRDVFHAWDETNMRYAVNDLFDGTVHDEDGEELNPGDTRYVPAVVDRIRRFQEEHEDALKARTF